MPLTCSICTGVGANVREAADGVTIAQRKKNLGLLAASFAGHNDCVNFFVKQGANVNCTDKTFDIASEATICWNTEFTQRLWNQAVHGKWTPLICAAANGDLESVKLLIATGADVNIVKCNRTALTNAAVRGHYKCIEYFIEAGANVNPTDPTVTPPLICATRNITICDTNRRKSIGILINSGANVNISFPFWAGPMIPLVEVAEMGYSTNFVNADCSWS